MSPAQRESLIKAMATGDFAMVQNIQSQLEAKIDNRDVVHLNTFIDFMKTVSTARNERITNVLKGSNGGSANESLNNAVQSDSIWEDPNVIIKISPNLQSILDAMMNKEGITGLDKAAISRYEAKFGR